LHSDVAAKVFSSGKRRQRVCGAKLIVSYLIGSRDADAAFDFMSDVAERLANRVQLTTDDRGA
jgi:hypothetical protein